MRIFEFYFFFAGRSPAKISHLAKQVNKEEREVYKGQEPVRAIKSALRIVYRHNKRVCVVVALVNVSSHLLLLAVFFYSPLKVGTRRLTSKYHALAQ